MLTARTKTIERTGTGRQFPPSLASLSVTKFSLQIYMELTVPYIISKFSKNEETIYDISNLLVPDFLRGNLILKYTF